MKMFFWILAIFALLLFIWMVGSILVVKSIEKPQYDVLEVRSGYELREYSDYIVAQVEVEGNQQEALNQGFRLLAGYIFGGNTTQESIAMTSPVNDISTSLSSEKISMTSPVNDISSGENKHTIQFVLPSKYTLETLPIPDNNQVKLIKVEGYTAAALSYTLWASEEKVEKNKQKLREYLQRDNLKIIEPPISAQYNPPLSFPLVRRNEIIAEIR